MHRQGFGQSLLTSRAKMTVFDNPALERTIAKFLFVASKDEPPEIAGLYRAAALALIHEPIDAGLLEEASKSRTIDDALYGGDVTSMPMLTDVWELYQKIEKGGQ
jgi:hypothetical protein